MRVLIACEFSGVVREAFRARGHDAWSCDLLPAEDGSPFHIVGDAREQVCRSWDLVGAHPPCTFLTRAQSGWYCHPEDRKLPLEARRAHPKFPNRQRNQDEAIEFFKAMLAANAPLVYVENPRPEPRVQKIIGKPQQIIQPWEFGHGECKATCLWLKGLPPLMATMLHVGREQRLHRLPPSETRQRERSRTYPGIAAAMAQQWG